MMKPGTIDRLIINSPYDEPTSYWSYDRTTRAFTEKEGRRPAGYIIASESSKSFDDPGRFIEIPLVNQIRPRVKAWRENRDNPYVGVTGITKRLLEHWRNLEARDDKRFFFCQLEAIETLIWLTEAPDAEKVGIDIPSDGGEFRRLCCKMATGSGKTINMAMLIAWQVINKVTYPQDTRFSKNVFAVAPGLTVKGRLQVLIPSDKNNYYDEFNIVPSGLREKLNLGRVMIRNWHTLHWESEEKIRKKRSVDKRGAKSNEAYVKEVLGEMASAKNILVINDEAHHAWRINPEAEGKYFRARDLKDSAKEATVWIGGLDRIHQARGILNCYDFSATPFTPSGKKSSEEALFGWIVSDFGLNDAIESGLVKTPRVVIRDDGKYGPDYKSRLYHIYADEEVKEDINRKAEEQETLPDLITNGYYLLGKDWLETAQSWQKLSFPTPPVMITVCNRTETAARVKFAFDHKKIRIDELCDPDRILHIDSKVLEKAESLEESPEDDEIPEEAEEENGQPVKLTKKKAAEELRKKVDTVGKPDQPGEFIQKVISVGMLSEGWDAKTVTHIMGLRAFSSQLLCEQVVGRGLRRTSYEINPETGLFDAEYVNIFGVPFTFLPHETQDGPVPPPPQPKTRIEPVAEKLKHEIRWPNVLRIETVVRPLLKLDMSTVKPLELDAQETILLAELAPTIDGKQDVTKISEINLLDLAQRYRMQRNIFEASRDIFDQMQPSWRGGREFLLAQIVKLVEEFISARKIIFLPPLFAQDELRQRILIALNNSKIVHHIWSQIRQVNTEALVPVFDSNNPIRSTGDMTAWYTGKPNERTKRSHINFCVYDSTWEASEAGELDRNSNVESWAKNDHLGFVVQYIYRGVVKGYRPDFLIRLKNSKMLVLEVKGQDDAENRTKRQFLDEWTKAINQDGRFGSWAWDVSVHPKDIVGLLDKNK
jgi:type III restriction enzyme